MGQVCRRDFNYFPDNYFNVRFFRDVIHAVAVVRHHYDHVGFGRPEDWF